MLLAEIGAIFLLLLAVFLFGQIWFALVEAVWKGIKRLLFRQKEPPVWHPFPSEQETENIKKEHKE